MSLTTEGVMRNCVAILKKWKSRLKAAPTGLLWQLVRVVLFNADRCGSGFPATMCRTVWSSVEKFIEEVILMVHVQT